MTERERMQILYEAQKGASLEAVKQTAEYLEQLKQEEQRTAATPTPERS